MNKDKVLQLIGLSKKANKIVSGESAVVENIRSNKVYLVFLASDTKVNTTKKIRDKSSFYNVRVIEDFDTEELNKAIGTNNRKVIGVKDRNFAKMITSQLDK